MLVGAAGPSSRAGQASARAAPAIRTPVPLSAPSASPPADTANAIVAPKLASWLRDNKSTQKRLANERNATAQQDVLRKLVESAEAGNNELGKLTNAIGAAFAAQALAQAPPVAASFSFEALIIKWNTDDIKQWAERTCTITVSFTDITDRHN